MRNFILLLISTSLFCSCGRVDFAHFSSFPDVMAVANKLDSDYKIYGSKTVYFSLAKKPKGWFVVSMDKKTRKPIAEELFWSANSKSYERIPREFFRLTESTGEIEKIKFEIRQNEYNYDHSIYYGYEGWEDEVIDEIGSKNLNDTLSEALARAYASKCMSLTRDEKDAMGKRSGKISDKQLEGFLEYGNKSLETYRKLLEINPDYETIVGKVKTKLSNEHMFLWSELKQSGRDKDAEQFLIDGLYDELMINFSKNMLSAAEKDGIIFTNGDNDTYPLWYAQAKLGVRKDLAVMNTSLINIPGWIFSARDNYKFDLGISDKFYYDTISDVIYLDNSQENIFGMSTAKAGLENNDPSFSTKTSDGSAIARLPFNHIRLSYLENDSLAPIADINRSYFFKSDLAIFDIIASNLGKRPIYFAQTAISGTQTDAIKRKLLSQGLLVRVVQGDNPGKLFQDAYYDLDICYNNFTHNYNYGIKNIKSIQVESIALNYIYNFNNLSNALFENGDTLRGVNAAMVCLNSFDLSLFVDPVPAYLVGDVLCRGGKTEEGRKLLAMSMDKIRIAYLDPKNSSDLERYNSILERIIDLSDRKRYSDLSSSATKLKEKIDKKIRERPADKFRGI